MHSNTNRKISQPPPPPPPPPPRIKNTPMRYKIAAIKIMMMGNIIQNPINHYGMTKSFIYYRNCTEHCTFLLQ